MKSLREFFLWILPKEVGLEGQQTIELQHEYQNPEEALKDLAQGVDKREPPTVRAVSPDRVEGE